MIRGFYTMEEVSQLAGLKIKTVQSLLYETTLTRGRDFTTLRRYRFGRCQHKIVFTKVGLQRVIARDYRRLKNPNRPYPPKDRDIIERLYREAKGVKLGSPNTIEGKLRRKQLRVAELARFLNSHPCSVLACACMCHNVGRGIYPVINEAKTSTAAPEVAFTAEAEEAEKEEE